MNFSGQGTNRNATGDRSKSFCDSSRGSVLRNGRTVEKESPQAE